MPEPQPENIADDDGGLLIVETTFPVSVAQASTMQVVVAPNHPARKGFQSQWKRIMDLVFAALALTLLAPVLVVLMIVIRIDSPGPAIFRPGTTIFGRRGSGLWQSRRHNRSNW